MKYPRSFDLRLTSGRPLLCRLILLCVSQYTVDAIASETDPFYEYQFIFIFENEQNLSLTKAQAELFVLYIFKI